MTGTENVLVWPSSVMPEAMGVHCIGDVSEGVSSRTKRAAALGQKTLILLVETLPSLKPGVVLASRIAWRNVPGPLLAVDVTTKVAADKLKNENGARMAARINAGFIARKKVPPPANKVNKLTLSV